ncbi:polysaccharide deacetylase family protein [Bacillus shivajii]|uniref:polysaccharide deacetylase family protein n=1 Tax=Bacillus shivajii TaxID=1983719 RepID=UPI001CF98EDB|nr:polysaccharide deacetylase family protein [Bacillus shivajii]UCZ51677.1 polysaccharide deacetylase family protein [Bacillus shivajii]
MFKKAVIQFCTFVIIFIITFSSTQHPITKGYIMELHDRAEVVMKNEDPLYLEILSKKESYSIAPQDAVIDKVWKAIPGLNGMKINVAKTYEKMKQTGTFNEREIVFDEVSPKVTLKDLPPAPIYRGNSEKKMASFMINVAWGNEYIPEILKTLNDNNIKSTFYLDGSWVKNNPKLAKMIEEEGHEIGNHAYSHPNMKNLSKSRIEEEIVKTNEIIKATLNEKPEWFAPPSGSYRQDVVDVAREHGLYTILWTVDTVDWKKPNHTEMANRVIRKTEAGSLILMHPTSSTVKGLQMMIDGIEKKGLTLGTVGETLSEKRNHINSH